MKAKFIKKAVCALISMGIILSALPSAVFADDAYDDMEWEQVVSTIEQGSSNHSTHDEGDYKIYTDFYNGEIETAGKVYKIKWKGQWYRSAKEGKFYISGTDSAVELFSRPEGGKVSCGSDTFNYGGTDTLFYFQFEIILDFTSDTPTAFIDVYDVDQTTLLGRMSTDISGIDKIKSIYYKAMTTSTIALQRPHKSTMTIEIAKINSGGSGGDDPISTDPDDWSWKTVKEGSGQRRSGDTRYFDLYDGNLPVSEGTKYHLTWNLKFYKGGGVNSGSLTVADADSNVVLFTKKQDSNYINDSIEFATLGGDSQKNLNPHPLVVDVIFDFDTHQAEMNFYDDADATMLLGTKTVDISGIDRIKQIYYYMPVLNDWTAPQNSSFVIQKWGVFAEEPEEPQEENEKEWGEWETVLNGNGQTRSGDSRYLDLYDGDKLSSSFLRYKIRWNASFYAGGGVNEGHLTISDDNSSVVLFTKTQDKSDFGTDLVFSTKTTGPQAVTIDMVFDFSKKEAEITFYSGNNANNLIGTTTVDISGVTGISKIYYYMPSRNDYTAPQGSSYVLMTSKIYPKVRSATLIYDGGEEKKLLSIDGTTASDDKIVPLAKYIEINLNTPVLLEGIEDKISLQKDGTDVNLLSNFTQNDEVLKAEISGILDEETKYILKICSGIEATEESGGEELSANFTLSFTTGKKQMKATVANPVVENNIFKIDVTLNNTADIAKSWVAVISYYDENGILLWTGFDNTKSQLSAGEENTETAEIALPPATIIGQTRKKVVYIWDSIAATEIFAEQKEIN